MASHPTSVVVVGGGVIGLSTAYYLARRGAGVVLLERDQIGSGASSGNAGVIAPGHEPMTRPGRIRQALRWMGDPTAPLYLPPRWDPALLRWLWRFGRYCTRAHLRFGTEALAPLGKEGRALFDELLEEEGIECAFLPGGYLEVYRSPEGFAGTQEMVALQHALGYATEELSGEEVAELEPTLHGALAGGLLFPEAATLDPGRFLKGLEGAVRRLGVEVRTGAAVQAVEVSGGRTQGVRLEDGESVAGGAVVLATGAYSLELARVGGLRIPLQPAKGYHRDLEATRVGRDADGEGLGGPILRRAVVFGERYVFCTPMQDFLRLAGTLEFSGWNHTLVKPRLEMLSRVAGEEISGLDTLRVGEDWVGLRPVTVDGLPAVGPAPGAEGLYVATGHAMLGLTLGPVTGKLLADWVLEGRAPSRLLPFRPDRF